MQPFEQLVRQIVDNSFVPNIYDNPVGKSAHISEMALEIRRSRVLSRRDFSRPGLTIKKQSKERRKKQPDKRAAKALYKRINRLSKQGLTQVDISLKLGFSRGHVHKFLSRWKDEIKKEGWQ